MKDFLKISYLVLGVLSLLCLLIYFFGPIEPEWVKDIALNLGTEILGILLAVFLIDEIIRKKQEEERKKYEVISFQQLKFPLRHHLTNLFNIYKSSVQEAPNEEKKNLTDFFDETYFNEIRYFDFTKQAPIAAPMEWLHYLPSETKKFKESLSSTVDKYAIYLKPETIEIMENLINSSLLSFLEQIPAIKAHFKQQGITQSYNFFYAPGMNEMVQEHTDLFTQLACIYNTCTNDSIQLEIGPEKWRNDISPQIGSARVQIST